MTTKQYSASVSSAAHPLVLASLGCYLLFLLLTYLGAGRWGFWFLAAWPYAFLLALQRFVMNPSGLRAFVAAWTFGGLVVVLFAGVIQRARFLRGRAALSVVLAVVVWYLPLGALTLVAQGAARLFGWPYGE